MKKVLVLGLFVSGALLAQYIESETGPYKLRSYYNGPMELSTTQGRFEHSIRTDGTMKMCSKMGNFTICD